MRRLNPNSSGQIAPPLAVSLALFVVIGIIASVVGFSFKDTLITFFGSKVKSTPTQNSQTPTQTTNNSGDPKDLTGTEWAFSFVPDQGQGSPRWSNFYFVQGKSNNKVKLSGLSNSQPGGVFSPCPSPPQNIYRWRL